MREVLFPQVSGNRPLISDGVVSTWFVADGERVERDQLIAEVQVDKATAEVRSPDTGTIRLLVSEGVEVSEQAPIARIE